jgi:hypothetical protein
LLCSEKSEAAEIAGIRESARRFRLHRFAQAARMADFALLNEKSD